MKKVLGIVFLSLCIYGCTINPSKEGRLQQLEADIEQSVKKIDSLSTKIQAPEIANKQLESRLVALESKN
jgi:cell division protein FtsB